MPGVARGHRRCRVRGMWCRPRRSRSLRDSASLLQLFATDTERSGRERGEPFDRDRVAAPLAPAVAALFQAFERTLDLIDALEDAVGQRDLLLALERLRARVGLVVASRVGEPVT